MVGHPDLIQKYYHSPEMQAFARGAHEYPMSVNADGTLSAEDVPPGTYIRCPRSPFCQRCRGKSLDLMTASDVFVTVPADPPTGQLNAGTVEMRRSSQ